MRRVDLAGLRPESFRVTVIARDPGVRGALGFWLRLLVDTPHRSLISAVRPILRGFQGTVLDVGAGAQFYRRYLAPGVRYRAVERASARRLYGWEGEAPPGTDTTDGRTLPYSDGTFDHVLCLEVLEHAEDAEQLLREIARVLKPGGTLLASMPFAARWHYVPEDYRRLTPSGIARLVEGVGTLELAWVGRRGTDLTVALHTLCSALIGLLWRRSVGTRVLGALLLPLGVLCGVAANLTEMLDLGAPENTLGYVFAVGRVPLRA